jgi:hypothetical protein
MKEHSRGWKRQHTHGRYDSFFKMRARVVPRNTRVGLPILFSNGMHGGGACHATVQLDIIHDGDALSHDGDQPIDALVAGPGACLAPE